MRSIRVACVVAIFLSVLSAGAATRGVAASVTSEGQLTGSPIADAWYVTAPTECAALGGCPTLPTPQANLYPADTLHVETIVGRETARTYLALDASQVPSDAALTRGRLTLPLSADSDSGTFAPEDATLVACLAPSGFPDDVAGERSDPPEVDCRVSSTAELVDEAFIVDLAPFLAVWRDDLSLHGLALMPAPADPGVATWHVTFDSRERQGPDVRTIDLVLDYTVPPTVPGLKERDPAYSPPVTGFAAPDIGLPLDDLPLDELAPVRAPRATAPTQVVAVFPAVSFRYPVAMALPLALLIGALFLVRTFTQAATPSHAALRGSSTVTNPP
jgi:hypothetical protein